MQYSGYLLYKPYLIGGINDRKRYSVEFIVHSEGKSYHRPLGSEARSCHLEQGITFSKNQLWHTTGPS
jgi:hypothetical protein